MTKGGIVKTQEIVLSRRPVGWPKESDFDAREIELGELEEGQVLVKTLLLSVDPYMRSRMNDAKSYIPPFNLDEALNGGGVAQVVSSRSSLLAPGDFVVGTLRWREFDTAESRYLTKVDPEVASLSAYLGVLGMPGLTAFVGIRKIGEVKPSDTVFVSGAAGAVGSVAGQIAKISGATVVGSAGSQEKVESLFSKGFDFAFNYREFPVEDALREFAPQGIDVYFDNVGGEHLRAAIANMANYGRIVMCGAISQYNLESPQPGPDNLMLVVRKRLTMRGFIVSDHYDLQDSFLAEASWWLKNGKLRYDETIREGLLNAPAAFIEMMRGANMGKMLVKVNDPN